MSKRKKPDYYDDDNFSAVSNHTMDDLSPGYIRFDKFTYEDLLFITTPIPFRYLNEMTIGSEIDEIVFYDLNRTRNGDIITNIYFEVVTVQKIGIDTFEITNKNNLKITAKIIPINQPTELFDIGYDCFFKSEGRKFHLRKIKNGEDLRKILKNQRHRRLLDDNFNTFGGIKKRKSFSKRTKKTYKNKKNRKNRTKKR